MFESLVCCLLWFAFGLLLGFLLFWLYDKFFRRDGSDWLSEKEQEIKSLRAQLDDSNKKIDNYDIEIKNHASTIQDYEKRIKDYELRLADTEKEQEIERLRAQLDESNKKVNDYDIEIKNHASTIQDYEKRIKDYELRLADAEKAGSHLNSAAKFGFSPMKNGEDDLTIIEGIGPKICAILKEKGYKQFTDVAKTEVSAIQTILDEKGPSFRLAKPGSWPKQAAMCVSGDWKKLKEYQDRLVNGVEFDD